MNPIQKIKTAHGSKPIVGIIGGHLNNTNQDAINLAEKTGESLADFGFTIACGGEDGIMESVCMGAKKRGGTTIAITKSNKKGFANKFTDYEIPTSLDLAFMNVLAWSSDAIIAFDGKFGTMCEIGLVLDIGKPLVLLGKHELIHSEKINAEKFIHLKTYTDENIETAINFVIRNIN
ncbi:MAG: hypothetical protein UX81_C0010G0023 [Parcubacteria group bacterium GW2011_GWA2_47_12]|nr:MAG: hypothetical protein UX81_C0010G0023 [Parcubacteria group bacterium GW2011_GWA2_47_12]